MDLCGCLPASGILPLYEKAEETVRRNRITKDMEGF